MIACTLIGSAKNFASTGGVDPPANLNSLQAEWLLITFSKLFALQIMHLPGNSMQASIPGSLRIQDREITLFC